MSINLQTYKSFQMVPIDDRNSHLLKKMVRFQAMHHKSKCVWDMGDKSSFSKLQSIMENNTNGTGGFFIFTPEHQEPAAYVVHMPIVSYQGRGLYMEDICVHPQCRHGGLGLYAISELAKMALETDREYVSWVVAANNESGQRFYNRLNSQRETTIPYYIAESNLEVNSSMGNTRELGLRDKIHVHKFCHQQGLAQRFMNFEEGHKLVASFNDKGDINAISLGGINTSTFRAVQGIEVTEVLYSRDLEQNHNQRRLVQNNLINRNIDISQKEGLTGHMIWGVEKSDGVLHRDIENNFGGEVLTMTNEPESVLDRHYLDRNQIQDIVKQHQERCSASILKESDFRTILVKQASQLR